MEKNHLILEISELPFSLEKKRKLGGYILSGSISIRKEGVKQMQPGSTQWGQAIGQEARGGN